MNRDCQQCGENYKRNPKYSNQQWSESKFCSRKCQYIGKDMSNYVSPMKGIKNHPSISGANSHLWKGGVTKENDKIRKSTEYRDWRIAVFERDNYTCQNCGVIGGDLQADHIKPFAYFIELRFDISNGRTLCKPCHHKTPTFGEKAKEYEYTKI